MYHIFFNHSSVNGHLGCSHVLVIVNSDAVNTRVYVSFRIMVFSRYMPRRGVAGSYGSSVFILSTVHTVLHVAVPVYIPSTSVGGSLFSTLGGNFLKVNLQWSLLSATHLNIYSPHNMC